MKLVIGNKTIMTYAVEEKAVKSIVSKFIKKMKDLSDKAERPSMFLTFLLVMHLMTADLLEGMTPEDMIRVFDRQYKKDLSEEDVRKLEEASNEGK